MTQTTELLQVEVPASKIAGLAQFEATRSALYDPNHPIDLTERQAALSDLLETTQVMGGVVLSDVVMESLTSPEETSGEKAAREAMTKLEEVSDAVATLDTSGEHEEVTYRFRLDTNGDPLDVLRIVPIPEDKKATRRNQAVSKRMPSGPKQNSSSFKTNVRPV